MAATAAVGSRLALFAMSVTRPAMSLHPVNGSDSAEYDSGYTIVRNAGGECGNRDKVQSYAAAGTTPCASTVEGSVGNAGQLPFERTCSLLVGGQGRRNGKLGFEYIAYIIGSAVG